MMRGLYRALAAFFAAFASGPFRPLTASHLPGLAGDWSGKLQVPGRADVLTVFHVNEGPDGAYGATVDSPMQGGFGLSVDTIRARGEEIDFALPSVKARFTARLSADGRSLAGQWRQGGYAFRLELSRLEQPFELPRPQNPLKPYPYAEERLSFQGGQPGQMLAGTLTLPDSPRGGLVFVSGSGLSDRDETIMGHKPFLVLADALARAGYAALRYDDRGVGESEGDHAAATSFDFAEDARAALSFLRSRPELKGLPIGLLGHSEGALIASILCATMPEPSDFAVLLGAPAWRGDELLLQQSYAILKLGGASAPVIDTAMKTNRRIYSLILSEVPAEELRASLRKELSKAGLSGKALEAQLAALQRPWFKRFLATDPADYLSRARLPVLALYGGLDAQVPSPMNPERMERLLPTDRHASTRVVLLPGLNHLLQKAGSGAVSEYGAIEETINEAALDVIRSWLAKV